MVPFFVLIRAGERLLERLDLGEEAELLQGPSILAGWPDVADALHLQARRHLLLTHPDG